MQYYFHTAQAIYKVVNGYCMGVFNPDDASDSVMHEHLLSCKVSAVKANRPMVLSFSKDRRLMIDGNNVALEAMEVGDRLWFTNEDLAICSDAVLKIDRGDEDDYVRRVMVTVPDLETPPSSSKASLPPPTSVPRPSRRP